jgi:carbon starvation protein
VYAEGIGAFMTVIFPVSKEFAVTFGAMAFSTFVFDTLDVGTRLGRYLLQELAGIRGRVGAILGTALTVAPPAFILWTAPAGSYMKFWTLFGASNQLLAALKNYHLPTPLLIEYLLFFPCQCTSQILYAKRGSGYKCSVR